MSFIRLFGRHILAIALFVLMVHAVPVWAQDYSSMGISSVVNAADEMLRKGDYRGAIPALQEVVNRTSSLETSSGRETLQTCRFQLAQAYYAVGNTTAGLTILSEYLTSQPQPKERAVLAMMARGYCDTENWNAAEEVAVRLMRLPGLSREERFDAQLYFGQACFRQDKWEACLEPLEFAIKNTKDEAVQSMCQIMVIRALMESKDWSRLFTRLLAVYRTDAKYDISLNLTLMSAGKKLFEEESYLNALMLYRWVLPREELLDHARRKMDALADKLAKEGSGEAESGRIQAEIDSLKASIDLLKDFPPYEQETLLRIGTVYTAVKRYWEGYALFDRVYQTAPDSEIGEVAMLESVQVLYDLNEGERAETRISRYLKRHPHGRYARALCAMMIKENLIRQDFRLVVDAQPYLDILPVPETDDDKNLQADLHYMISFGYLRTADFKGAVEQLTTIINRYPESGRFAEAHYYRGMARLMSTEYDQALSDFDSYRKLAPEGELFGTCIFREAVCYYGMEDLEQSEAKFSQYIAQFPDGDLISEAYSMRGDIEAAKEATAADPHTLERALADYRKGIDTAKTSAQGVYAAVQAAKVYRLEHKWTEIIDFMNSYMDRWGGHADIAEAVFWIGQARNELGEPAKAIDAYLDAIGRFGNDPLQSGVERMITELVNIVARYDAAADMDGLTAKLRRMLGALEEGKDVLRLRLRITQALLQGEDAVSALGDRLLAENIDLSTTTPISLALMCDAAMAADDFTAMERLQDYFIETFGDSEQVWHAYRARVSCLKQQQQYKAALAAVQEVQNLFGSDVFMGWAQLAKAEILYELKQYKEADEAYNMCLGIPQWRGPTHAEAMLGRGHCHLAMGQMEAAHALYQRTYLLYKSYNEGALAARGYLAAADVLLGLDRKADAVNTWKAMLDDRYTGNHPLTEKAREQLKKYGSL